MIRFAWRQFRVPFAVSTGALVGLAILLAITGSSLSHLYDTTVAHCGSENDCQSAIASLNTYDHFLQVVVQALPLIVPVLIGMFWGAPLVAREIESGSFRLALTQGRTRRQWLVGKVAVVGTSSVVLTGLLALMTTWWWNPINRANPNRFSPGLFSIFGLAPVGYAAFAFALGLLAGVIIRRTLPAMVTTLVGFIGARIVVNFWVRSHFATPLRLVSAINSGGGVGVSRSPSGISLATNAPTLPNAWVYSANLVNKSGQQPAGNLLQRLCPKLVALVNSNVPGGGAVGVRRAPGPNNSQNVFNACFAKLGASFHEVVSYQPAGRYWPFQFAETGLFLVVALAALALSYWWIRHRLT